MPADRLLLPCHYDHDFFGICRVGLADSRRDVAIAVGLRFWSCVWTCGVVGVLTRERSLGNRANYGTSGVNTLLQCLWIAIGVDDDVSLARFKV